MLRRFPFLINSLLLTSLSLTEVAVAQQPPIVPRPAQPKGPVQPPRPGQPQPPRPGQPQPPKPGQPQATPGEVDWRGLEEGGHKSGHRAPSPITALIKNAPYRVEIATTDGNKVLMTNAFTLERRRVYAAPAEPGGNPGTIAGMAFSADGAWLYVVTDAGEVLAVDADTAKAQTLGRLAWKAGETVVDVIGAGGLESPDLTVLLGQGPAPVLGQCLTWSAPRRARLHRDATAPKGTPVAAQWKDGWPDATPAQRLAAVSPNTKYRISVQNGALLAAGRFGGGDFKLNRTPVPAGVSDLDWMRDSEGLVATWPRRGQGGCKYLLGMRSWRHPRDKSNESGWKEWTLPETVEIQRGDLPRGVQWAPDGMRLQGVDVRGVLLIEPAPRFRGPLALVAPPSKLWPRIRPGVRALASTATGALRFTELLMEQGDLDAARRQLATDGAAGGPEVARLRDRLAKLEEVRLRRAEELHLDVNDLRSEKVAHPATPVQPGPVEEDGGPAEAVPGAGATPGPVGEPPR